MQKINKLSGSPSTAPDKMSYSGIVDIKTICDTININMQEIKTYAELVLAPIKRKVYIDYIQFSTQELEDKYLALETDDIKETLELKNSFLTDNEGEYTIEKDLHPNVKMLYTHEEAVEIISKVTKIEDLLNEINTIDSSFFDGIKRLDDFNKK